MSVRRGIPRRESGRDTHDVRFVALAAALALLLLATPARAQREPVKPPPPSYATALALSYGIPIGAEVAVWTIVALAPQSEPRPGYSAAAEQVGVAGLPTMWLSPAVVHIVNGQPLRGLIAFCGGLGSTAVGLALGLPVWANTPTDADHPWGTPAAGSLWMAFGLTAQTLWAVYDVNEHSTLPRDTEEPARAPVFQLAGAGIAPIRAGAAATARFTF